MLKIASNTAVRMTLLTIGLYWLIYSLIGLNATIELASSLVLGASFTLTVTWLPAVLRASWRAITGEALEDYELFHIGHGLLFLALLTNRVWITALRWAGRPDWMLESPMGPFTAWAIFCACSIILLSPGTIKGAIPVKNKFYVLFAAVLGALVAGITIGIFIAS